MSAKGLKLTTNDVLLTEQITVDSQLMLVQALAAIKVGLQPRPLMAKLATSGGATNFGVDGSVTPVTFDLTPTDPNIYRIERLRLVVQAATAVGLSGLGDLGALANGLTLQVLDTNLAEIYDVLEGKPIKSGLDLAALGRVEPFAVGTDHVVVAEIALVSPIRLEAGLGERLRLTVSDNLGGLTRAELAALGCVEDVRS